ncbi:unnamed protein product [Effrenium voratum]|nr:unnamed protein product [Effrenium voratum]
MTTPGLHLPKADVVGDDEATEGTERTQDEGRGCRDFAVDNTKQGMSLWLGPLDESGAKDAPEPMALARSRSAMEARTKLPQLTPPDAGKPGRRAGSLPPPGSQSASVPDKLPAIGISVPGRGGGYAAGETQREEKARPKPSKERAAKNAPRSAPALASHEPRRKPPPPRPPASKEAPVPAPAPSSPAASAPKSGLRNFVSEELRKVLDEEDVAYSWRRRPRETTEAPSSEPKPPSVAPERPEPKPRVPKPPGRPGGYSAAGAGVLAVAKPKSVSAASSDLGAPTSRPFPERLVPELVKPSVRLVAYGGGVAMLSASALCSVGPGDDALRAPPPQWLQRWLRGLCSSELANLAAESWLHDECSDLAEESASAGSALALSAGLLVDPGTAPRALAASPLEAAAAAAQQVLEATQASGHLSEIELMASEAEVALARLETGCRGREALQAALRREVFRFMWCSFAPLAPPRWDEWLEDQLRMTPHAAEEYIRGCTLEDLEAENRFLDRYLVRLLKLKRRLAKLLEALEKVDHYKILGVASDVSDKELRAAYRKACLRLHPDKGGDKQQFQQLQDSYARILEEREQDKAKRPAPPPAPGRSAARAPAPAARSPAPDAEAAAEPLAIEGADVEEDSAAAEVLSATDRLRHLAEELHVLIRQAEKADARIRGLKSQEGVEALAAAQDAGEELLKLSQRVGEFAPKVSEASMEVAESSLSVAARFTSVPCALLLTDVALSCTLEASRLQHTGKAATEVGRDTTSTLHTLQANLQMAKILGTVDAETLKLSLNLVTKASRRMLAAMRSVDSASADAVQRSGFCLAHARAVCRFAAGRPPDEVQEEQAALPAPEGSRFSPKQEAQGSQESPSPERAQRGDFSHFPCPPGAPPERSAHSRSVQSRLQSDRLLRQLDLELRQLQARLGSKAPMQPSAAAKELVAELLQAATANAVESKDLRVPFLFVERCTMSAPWDIPAQLARMVALAEPQAHAKNPSDLAHGSLTARRRCWRRCGRPRRSSPRPSGVERWSTSRCSRRQL